MSGIESTPTSISVSWWHYFSALREETLSPKPKPWRLTRHLPGFRALRDGEEWHRQDWTEDMLAGGWRPVLIGERPERGDELIGQSFYALGSDWHTVSGKLSSPPEIFPALFQRTRRPLPEPAKVVPWDGPEDVPKPVCWVRVKDRLDTWASLEAMVIAVSNASMTVQCRDLQHILWRDVEAIKKIEYSTDRINWKPCTKEVAP